MFMDGNALRPFFFLSALRQGTLEWDENSRIGTSNHNLHTPRTVRAIINRLEEKSE